MTPPFSPDEKKGRPLARGGAAAASRKKKKKRAKGRSPSFAWLMALGTTLWVGRQSHTHTDPKWAAFLGCRDAPRKAAQHQPWEIIPTSWPLRWGGFTRVSEAKSPQNPCQLSFLLQEKKLVQAYPCADSMPCDSPLDRPSYVLGHYARPFRLGIDVR